MKYEYEKLISELKRLDDLYDDLRRSPLYYLGKCEYIARIDDMRKRYELAIIESGGYPTF